MLAENSLTQLQIAAVKSALLALLISITASWASAASATEVHPLGVRGIAIPAFTRAHPLGAEPGKVGFAFEPFHRVRDRRFAQRIRREGFDFVRLIVNPLPLIYGPEASRQRARQAVSSAAQMYDRAGLGVMVDMHFWTPEPGRALEGALGTAGARRNYARSMAALSSTLASAGGRFALELLNEPPLCDGRSALMWSDYQVELLRDVRAAAPELLLVATGCGGQLEGLLQLSSQALASDQNVLFTFHFYEPYTYTHQLLVCRGCPELKYPHVGIPDASLTHLPKGQELFNYLRRDAGPLQIAQRLQLAADWARRAGVAPTRVILGEFGAVIGPNPRSETFRSSELRWLHDVTAATEAQGFAWAFWGFPDDPRSYDYDSPRDFLRADIVRALLRDE